MEETKAHFEVFREDKDAPVMFGICVPGGVCVRRVSSDFYEVGRLAAQYNRSGLSPVHLEDAVEDFRKG